METRSFTVVHVLIMGTALMTAAQTPAVAHNTWTAGAPMPSALVSPAAAVLEGQIYVVGGTTVQHLSRIPKSSTPPPMFGAVECLCRPPSVPQCPRW
jgi:hypothetical protein